MTQVTKFKLRNVRSFSENISSTFDFIRMNYKIILKIFIRIPGPIILLSTIILMYGFSQIYGLNLASQNSQQGVFDTDIYYGFSFMSIGIILYVISSLLFTSAINEFIVLYEETENPENISVSDVYLNTKIVFWKYIGGGILIGVLVLIGFIFFIIPGIYLAVVLGFLFIILSVERISPIDSISRSFTVIKGNWWATFGYIIVIAIMVMAISYIVQLPIIILNTYLLVAEGLESVSSMFYGISNGLSYLFYLIISAISITSIAVYYYSLVEKKEQVGLQKEISRMDENKDD